MTEAAHSRAPAAHIALESEAVESTVRYEGLVTRAIAFAVDAALVNVIAIVVAAAIGVCLSILSVPDSLDQVFAGLGGAAFLAWATGYFVVFWATTGQTPGSRLMRIRVCRADTGAVIGASTALLRIILLTLAAIPLFAGFLPILFDARRRGVHDMLAGTVVVEAPELTPGRAAAAGDGGHRPP